MNTKSRYRLFLQLVIATSAIVVLLAKADKKVTESLTIELTFKPDIENGVRIYEICASCHLPDGWGNPDGVYPQLAGQHASVLMKQLVDIREGKRENPAMFPFVQQRSLGGYQNLVDVVAYISTLPMTPENGKGKWDIDTNEYQQGKLLYDQKCMACHGSQAEGNSVTRTPRLQGQHYAYLVQQARLIATRQRTANTEMVAVARSLNHNETEKAMNYISRIPVPEADVARSTE